MKHVVAWTAGMWTLVQGAAVAVKLWVRPEWPWLAIMLPTILVAAVAAVLAVGMWLLYRAVEIEEVDL